MKKIAPWMIAISLVVFIIAWGIMGMKIFNGNYDAQLETYIGLAALVVFWIFILIMKFSSAKCPHCGKVQLQLDKGKYCYRCGKEV